MQDIVADLHLHTTFSDGLNTPEELAQQVAASGLKAYAITDHDTVKGVLPSTAPDKVTLIPGLELTATHEGKEVHVLGYYIHLDHAELLETLENIASRRVVRLYGIIDRLNSSGNVKLDKNEISLELENRSFNRLNLARFMVKKGIANNVEGIFAKYIGDSAEAYEAVDYFSPVDAIKLIHRAGGIAFLAHPYSSNISAWIPELVEYGLNGIEAFHPSHGADDIKKCLDWATRFKIGVSGGSDFHGGQNSKRKLLSAGLNGERFVNFMSLNPLRDFVTA